jgi:glycosyltransferase involved in cell wall biosynthesis
MVATVRTFSTLATAGSYTLSPQGQVLVGRTVANTQFLRALVRHGSFEQYVLFIGENGDRLELEKLSADWDTGRLKLRHLLELPHALANGEVDVVHHNTPGDKLFDLFWLRNRYAKKTIPVTGQVHSLSYPRMPRDDLAARWLQPRACDAIFCSSQVGRLALEKTFAQLPEASPLPCSFPVVPLGVDLEQVQGGDRAGARSRLSIPENAFVLLSMARFSEYDKTDLFPFMQVVRQLFRSPKDATAPVYVLLAGARQGTQTPEMLQLWSKVLGFEGRLRLLVDFPETDKKHLLAASDVFVSPCDNVQETFGQSVVEAMAAGLPVVVSDFDGYKDTVEEGTGLRSPTRLNVDWDELSDLAPILYERPLHLLLGQSVEVDLGALFEALSGLHQSPERRRALGDAARAAAEARFSWKNVIPQYEAVWKALAAKPPPAAQPGPHPLRMDLGEVFSHYPTARQAPSRKVQRTHFSKELIVPGAGLKYVLYPELKHLFSLDDVVPLLERAEGPLTVEALLAHAQSLFPQKAPWVAQLMVSWMLKHGLLASA